MPDLMHAHAVAFVNKHRDTPFFLYYSLSHVHGEIVRTPDSAPGSKDLYADNLAYMDKLVGKFVAELDRLKLRENTLLVFVGAQLGARWTEVRDALAPLDTALVVLVVLGVLLALAWRLGLVQGLRGRR